MAAPCARSVSVPRGSASGPCGPGGLAAPPAHTEPSATSARASPESSAATIAALPIPSDVRSRPLQYFKTT